MLFKLLLVTQALVAATMIGLILMQKSEGGGLGVGGSPSGMLSARGAADFLTRATTFCAIGFVGLSIALAGLASTSGGAGKIDASAAKKVAPAAAVAPVQTGVPVDAGAAGVAGPTVKPSDIEDAKADAAAAAALGAGSENQKGVPIGQ
jgi:preprotein translocase subunit SecG